MKNYVWGICLLWIGLSSTALQGIGSISILTKESHMDSSVSRLAIEDCLELLQQACECTVDLDNPQAEIILALPEIAPQAALAPSPWQLAIEGHYPLMNYPLHHYTWRSERRGEQIYLSLETLSHEGIAFGLYGLLQEQLWFSFYHPKEQLIPQLKFWPLTEEFEWQVHPRFEKRGFHLHTMHPIELTEALLNPDYPSGMVELKRYMDWLARNQQNYFEFNLLNSIDEARWHSYIGELVQYGRSRGIIMGIDLSLDMRQQKAYRLYYNWPKSWKSKKKQMQERVERLMQNPWQVVNLEFSSTEYTKGKVKRKLKLRRMLLEDLDRRGVKLMGREHVVQSQAMLGGKKKPEKPEDVVDSLDAKRGTMIHTVMCYSVSEDKAPVYKNENLQHMYTKLKARQQVRETWFYPESAYWVSFDNSVPMLLLPYLSSRLSDIQLMESRMIPGHVTFSSGWEWGYWLIDWSIARWSWRQEFNGLEMPNYPVQYMSDLFKNQDVVPFMDKALSLQEKYLKDQNLIRLMAASTVTDELPTWLNKMAYQPRLEPSYNWWRYKAPWPQADSLRRNAPDSLRRFAEQTEGLLQDLRAKQELFMTIQRQTYIEEPRPILDEIMRGMAITALRARHKALTLDYLLQKRRADALKEKMPELPAGQLPRLIMEAQKVRAQAQALVKEQEQWYRYPKEYLAGTGRNATAYSFGYLYPVTELHFWNREEQQVLQDKYGYRFMNIWEVWRILGLKK